MSLYTTDPARHSGDIPRQVKTHDNTHAVAAFHYYRSVVFRIDDCDLCSVPIRIPGCARFTPRHTSTPTTTSEVHTSDKTSGELRYGSQVKSSLRYGTHVIRDNYVSPSSIVRHVCAQHDSASRELSLPLSHAGSKSCWLEVIMSAHESNSCSVSNAAGMPWALRVECRR